MKRRNFIRKSALASIAGTSGFAYLSSCTNIREDEKLPKVSPSGEFVLNEVTIEELQQKMQSGEMTS
ncbi:MAG TPA: amidase, partial [Chryseolinea sp.]|nr:amidase [Chryseolinea sp.]